MQEEGVHSFDNSSGGNQEDEAFRKGKGGVVIEREGKIGEGEEKHDGKVEVER